jgi:hypothetical protein
MRESHAHDQNGLRFSTKPQEEIVMRQVDVERRIDGNGRTFVCILVVRKIDGWTELCTRVV